MNTPLFIAKRLIKAEDGKRSFARPVNVIAVTGIALGMAVMILAVAVLTGFKNEIRDKVVGFGSHIQVVNFDSNISYEMAPISANQEFLPRLLDKPGIKAVQVFGVKAGIAQVNENIQGVVLKGIGSDHNWSFFEGHLAEGELFTVTDTARTNQVVISRKLGNMLEISVGDRFPVHFVQEQTRSRVFTVSGIYDTGLEEFDEIYIFCDIGHIRRLNGWEDHQISGFDIFIDRFSDLDYMTYVVRSTIGYQVTEDQERLRVSSIRMRYPQIFDWLSFQDLNVVVIITLMLLVTGFNMISGLLILILEKVNMIGVLKALGATDKLISRAFLYQAAWLTAKGLFWGNLIGVGVALIQLKTGFIKLDPASYYLSTVPVNIELIHLLLLNAGAMAVIITMQLLPARLVGRITPVKAIRYD